MGVMVDTFKITSNNEDIFHELEDYEEEDGSSAKSVIENGYWVYRGGLDMDDVIRDLSLRHKDETIRMLVKTDCDEQEWCKEAINGEVRELEKEYK